MREIRVRGRSVEQLVGDDQWVYGFGVQVVEMADGSKQHVLYTPHGTYTVDPATVGQYTGKKDAEKTEMFDGDNLYAPGNLDNDLQYVGTVEWDEEDCRWEVSNFHGRWEYIPDGCVVRGNRYENAEMAGDKHD